MFDTIENTKRAFAEELQKAATLQDLEQVRIKFLARNGEIAVLFEGMKTASVSERPVLGKALNELRQDAQTQFDAKKLLLEQSAKPKEIPFDLTLPGRPRPIGTKHPVVQVMEEMKRIFVSMGFSVETGPEIESDYYNFGALNFAPDHPRVICRIRFSSQIKFSCAHIHLLCKSELWRNSNRLFVPSCPAGRIATKPPALEVLSRSIRLKDYM